MKRIPPISYELYTYETINALMLVMPDVYNNKVSFSYLNNWG
ncbi:MAG TPA: hypothetical protein PKW23_03515 [Dictyoglomaceae bacterium]|nr:hypothetical protein [Dictyoglomaceae bacterium]HOL39424.1 hypothetical protein [Dictyoglomaceae bacterium]HOP95538.1 hypothetical protein [Dictyoglomaceae bacterium]HPP16383.1 hypothetical protein [Dictyoglomaceae bacterium]HPU43483.1 hypothetical protein [Dictyoglomaceae bacterium]